MKPVIIGVIVIILVVAIGALMVTPEKETVSNIDKPTINPIPEQKELTSSTKENCDSSYPDVCITSYPPDLDCGEIGFSNFRVIGSDPHGFDRDNDGVGCES